MESVTFHDLLAHLSSLLTNIPASCTILPSSNPPLSPSSSILPSRPIPLSSLTTYFSTHILPHLNLASLSHNYYGFVTGGVTPAARLGDWLVSVWDQNVQVHLPAETIATNIEVAALNQLVELFNLPRDEWGISGNGVEGCRGSGTFTTGATASNVLGLALGREWVLQRATEKKLGVGKGMSCGEHGVYECMLAAGVRKVKVLSTLPHSSIGKAASLVGFGRGSIVSVAKVEGDGLAIDLEKLQREVVEEGTVSVLVVSAGEVNTGRFATEGIEMLKSVRAICNKYGVWMHADGAFGLFGRALMDLEEQGVYKEIVKGVEGLELADSITGDGHKLLQVPYDCGFFLSRQKDMAAKVCANSNATYLTAGTSCGDDIQSPLNIGLENSRRFRALPVHATLCAYGKGGYVDMLERQIALARRVVRWLWNDDRYEVLPNEAGLGAAVAKTFIVVLFRAKDEVLNSALAKTINATGRIYVTGTIWQEQIAVRIAVSNWQADVERDGKLIEEILDQVSK
ncbi:hypothetical protein DV736_g3870, partial [Chaetothyriales sp. CBS 134916]